MVQPFKLQNLPYYTSIYSKRDNIFSLIQNILFTNLFLRYTFPELLKDKIMTQDLTKGSPLKLIILFALPLLLGNIFQQLYNLADLVIVGRLIGINALAAVGATLPIYFLFLFITFGFTNGLTVVTAQRFGAKDYTAMRSSMAHCIVASLILSSIISLGMTIFMTPLLRIMNIPAEIMDDAYIFLFILSAGMILTVFFNLLSCFIRAVGDSRTPLYFLIFATIINIVLNLLLIGVFKMGVAGSATGTIIAICSSVVCCLIYIKKRYSILQLHKKDWKLRWNFMKEHLNIAIPMTIQFAILALSMLIIQSVCNSFGTEVIAAFSAGIRIEQLCTQPLLATGLAIATYTAQNWGAAKLHRIRQGVRSAALMSFVFSFGLAFLVRFVGKYMISVFMEQENENVINIACEYLNISTLFYFFLGMIFVFRNALQGMGKAIIPLIASIAELIMRSFAAIWLAAQIGYKGVFYAGPIAWLGAGIVVTLGYFLTIRHFSDKGLRKFLLSNKKAEI